MLEVSDWLQSDCSSFYALVELFKVGRASTSALLLRPVDGLPSQGRVAGVVGGAQVMGIVV